MIRSTKILCVAVSLLALAACGTLGNPDQGDAGITRAEVKVCTEEGRAFVCAAEIIDGKEKQSVKLTIHHPEGWTIDYAASDVRAFEAHKIRGAVEKSISADLKEAVPDIVGKVTGAVIEALTP